MKLKIKLLVALVAFTLADPVFGAQAIEVTDLRCEYLINPHGIDVTKPRLSWVAEDKNQKPETRGQKQMAYHLLVASTPELLANDKGDLWDSGKVEDDQSIQVEYKGKALDSRTRCFWKVRVWDKDSNPSAWSKASEWSMGLLNPADWTAKWITHGNAFDGADWIWFNEESPATKAPEGTRQFRRSITLPADRTLTSAKVRLTADNSFILTVNGQNAASGSDWAQPVEADITAALKVGDNNLAISATNTVSGAAGLLARFDFTFTSGEPLTVVTDGQWQASTDGAQWSNALSLGGSGIAPWGAVVASFPHPWVRKEFKLAARPDTAMAFVNVEGYYELYVNGEKVGDEVLSPAVSDPRKRTLYRAYEISKLLRPGDNCIGLWLGRGWSGSEIKSRVQLNMTIGEKEGVIGTDPSWTFAPSTHSLLGTWKWGNFGGERIDARHDIPDWSKPGCKAGTWNPMKECAAPAGLIVAQSCEPNRIGQVIPLAKCTSLGANVWELDFGTNLSGWLKLKLPGLTVGQKINLRFADKRFQSPAGDKTPAGDIRTSGEWRTKTDGGDVVYQSFNQYSEFISAGKKDEEFCSKFNYHGFRYVIVEGLTKAPELGDAQALLIETDLSVAGDFECSNDLFNRIHQVNVWTLRSLNLGGYMVDCPHRERLGYGDGQLAVESMIMSRHAPAFYTKWTEDWLDPQTEAGKLPHTAPNNQGGGGGPAWGGAGCVIPFKLYQFYGDKRLLARAYEPVRKYTEFLESQCTDGILRAYGGPWDFIGDWVPPGRGMDTNHWPGKPAAEFFNNCYRIYLIEQLAKVSEILGKTEESKRWLAKLQEIRPLIHKAFYDPAAKQYVIDEQSYQLMPLMTGVVPDELKETVMKRLEELIQVKSKGHLDTGMLGTYFLLQYLQETGRNDLVYTIMNQTTYPGWGYMVSQGATTLWEQWNGYFSQIHSCFTCPSGWFYQGLAGIRPDLEAPGFKNILIKPAIVGDLTWVKSHHFSPYGRIVSNWQREGNKLTMEVTIPVNATATIHVPAKNAAAVTESGNAIDKAVGVNFLRMENNAAVYSVGSGSYRFQSEG